jgi:hypothetical protein
LTTVGKMINVETQTTLVSDDDGESDIKFVGCYKNILQIDFDACPISGKADPN